MGPLCVLQTGVVISGGLHVFQEEHVFQEG